MNKPLLVGVSIAMLCAAGFATQASAQGKTRAEVRQELIDAENHGLRFVTDASYPDVSPLYQTQVDRMQAAPERSGTGSQAAGSTDAGKRALAPATPRDAACVGPVSFCTPYFGS
ncbi:DUF4148 domain-containing protein [Burkholderia ubonensis]|uniref:DUF4148 domain-containing protein n=1 Tax=Burkholderia ubonensis TaxID=101571 RepID=UPI000755C7A9|nr:DUF4148 domain-containing protein [Burkholderia ubonensis]KVT35462.1 hypothetical protein WK51_19660 [Burkholderia ubonensis]KVX90179.1 hypothetical protein WL08_28795 [Burkholderia ubonensis]